MNEFAWLDFSGVPQTIINVFALVIALNYLLGGQMGTYLSSLTKGFLEDRADRREFKQSEAKAEREFQRQVLNRYTAWSDKFIDEIDGLLEDIISEIEKLDLRHLVANETTALNLGKINEKLDMILKDGHKDL